MTRRTFSVLSLLCAQGALVRRARAESSPSSLRGKLTTVGEQAGALTLPGGELVFLTGDEPTRGVLRDARLNGVDFEVIGRRLRPGWFEIEPIHKRAMFVHKDGKKLFVTYWCAVCAIRTYTPGICWCCQEETALDLRESLEISNS
ncbi:MAG: hypothetical protein NZV14_13750 [Bryobacteraceae bacterium]|nr:hypothetical protein [Bryobacteraceae bacterium]MDW8379223.1 hypothetical protein [Bryobacterales bacterium]